MPNPTVESTDPVTFKVGKKHHILIIGRNFSEDDGSGGILPIQVLLEDSTHKHDWDNAGLQAAFISPKHILVTSTPKLHVAPPTGRHVPPHAGGGDLTITVTNGDGGGSGPIRVPGVSYT
jgi:hypothetical protein